MTEGGRRRDEAEDDDYYGDIEDGRLSYLTVDELPDDVLNDDSMVGLLALKDEFARLYNGGDAKEKRKKGTRFGREGA